MIYVFRRIQRRHFPKKKKRLRQAHRPRGGGLTPKIQVQTSKYNPDVQNASPDTQIQVQTPKYPPTHKSKHSKIKSRHPNTSPDSQIQVQTPKTQIQTPKIQYITIYSHIYGNIKACMAVYCHIDAYMAIYLIPCIYSL